MRHYLKFVGLFYGSIAFAALMLGLLSALDGFPGLVLLAFGLLSAFVALVIGAVVVFIHGLRCAYQLENSLHQAAVVLASPVLTVVVLCALLPLAALGNAIGEQANWTRYRPRDVSAPPIIVQPAPPDIPG